MLARTPLYAESWNVAWRRGNPGDILHDKETPFQIIENSYGFWAADPFPFCQDGMLYIFAELYDYVLRRGCLGYCRWTGEGFGPWKKVITEPYHLSYPCIFRQNGEIYIMPESGADHSLYWYRAEQFPDSWVKEKALRRDVVYGDTTIIDHQNCEYALAYDVEDAGDYKLWLLNLQNPQEDRVITSNYPVNTLRPAGNFFALGDGVYRPAQICIHDYGEGLAFYRCVVEGSDFQETLQQKIYPADLRFDKSILADGIHTYNAAGGIEVIDIKTRRFNLLNFGSRIVGKLGR